jgi:hypothetical protein
MSHVWDYVLVKSLQLTPGAFLQVIAYSQALVWKAGQWWQVIIIFIFLSSNANYLAWGQQWVMCCPGAYYMTILDCFSPIPKVIF